MKSKAVATERLFGGAFNTLYLEPAVFVQPIARVSRIMYYHNPETNTNAS